MAKSKKINFSDQLKGLLQIAFAIFIIIVIFWFSKDIGQFEEFGYLGVFLISLLATATIFIPTPGWAIVIAMAGVLNPYLVGITAGVGSALGEITGYVAGAGAEKMIKDGKFKKFEKYYKMIKENDLIAIFVLAFIPNPLFDVAGLAAGSLKIPLTRFLFATVLGRILRYVLLAHLGAFSLEYI
ncbi:MAG TPA: VTT domain-containing protein [Candidatus Bilamarchaeaceae archaeon]|nr:VTT domain-containing protein [Candidatus Bilamarchaeaceae archaeon]